VIEPLTRQGLSDTNVESPRLEHLLLLRSGCSWYNVHRLSFYSFFFLTFPYVKFRILVELFLALCGAEVIGLTLITALGDRIIRLYFHSAYRISSHSVPSFRLFSQAKLKIFRSLVGCNYQSKRSSVERAPT
jgi:hypothetical protein